MVDSKAMDNVHDSSIFLSEPNTLRGSVEFVQEPAHVFWEIKILTPCVLSDLVSMPTVEQIQVPLIVECLTLQ